MHRPSAYGTASISKKRRIVRAITFALAMLPVLLVMWLVVSFVIFVATEPELGLFGDSTGATSDSNVLEWFAFITVLVVADISLGIYHYQRKGKSPPDRVLN